ncbi:hypothetical protein D3C80_2142340 [compost metagenome]
MDQDRDCQKRDDGWLGNDLLTLKAKEQNQGCEKCHKRKRLQGLHHPIQPADVPSAVSQLRKICAMMTGTTM